MILAPETLSHAALALDAVLEGNANQLAVVIVGPGVIDAGKGLGIAEAFQAQQGAAVGTTVFERLQNAVLAPHQDHGNVAQIGGFIVAGFGHLAFQAQDIPGRALEQTLPLPCVDILVVINCKGNLGQAVIKPNVFHVSHAAFAARRARLSAGHSLSLS